MSNTPMTPAAPSTGARRSLIWSDNAARFVVRVPTDEEDRELALVAIHTAPVLTNVRIARRLLALVDREPDRLFYPTLWVEEELNVATRLGTSTEGEL